MQAERQINRESVICVTVFARISLLRKGSGDASGGDLSSPYFRGVILGGSRLAPPFFVQMTIRRL